MVSLKNFQNDEDLKEQQRIEKALKLLWFVAFVLIGSLLTHCLLF
jgi:hypothetical protein